MKQLLAAVLSALMTTPAFAQAGPAVEAALQSAKTADAPLKPRLKAASFTTLGMPHGGGARTSPPPQRSSPPPQRSSPPPQRREPPRQQPPRQEPPRRTPPPQQPPRRTPPPQQPPRRNPPGHEHPPVQRPPVVVHPNPAHGGRVELPRREPIRDHSRIMDPRHGGTEISRPRTFPDGRPINARPVTRGPHGDHITVINNTTVINNVRNYNRWETEHNRYYWHDWDGHHYCHYYDHYGYHWYGWYLGDVYFWTRYWNDMYWWYDPYYHRWVYMRDGRWWWQDPAHVEVVYLYTPETNVYYRYDDAPGGGVVMTPDPTQPVEAPPADPDQPAAPQPAQIFMSSDARRSVQIFGEKHDAFLYDASETPAFDPVFLTSYATEARFTQAAADQPLTVLVLTDTPNADGSTTKGFAMFDENGNATTPAPVAAPVQSPAPGEGETPAQPPTPSPTLDLLRSGVSF